MEAIDKVNREYRKGKVIYKYPGKENMRDGKRKGSSDA